MKEHESRPDIYLFNPTCEMAVANSHSSWQPNQLLQKMEQDLGVLPLFFARPHDVVLVSEIPPEHFLKHLEKAGINPPQFRNKSTIAKDTAFIEYPKNRLLPWGWSPAAHKLLNPLKSSCSDDFRHSPVASWKPESRELYSRELALGVLKSILPRLPREHVLSADFLPEVCTTRKEIEDLIGRWGRLMVKAPWSSSGRGLQPVTKTPVVPKVWEKLTGIIREQGYVLVEPYLDKVLDMALQFNVYKGKVGFIGISRFITDGKGQYQGNYLNGWPELINPEAAEFTESLVESLAGTLTQAIEKSILAKHYEGNFGIDTLVFRDKDARLRINPCLEINVRQNMGLLSLQLEKLLEPGRKGTFQLFFEKGLTFGAFQKNMHEKYPAQFSNNRLAKGFFPLTPVRENTLFGAYLLIPGNCQVKI